MYGRGDGREMHLGSKRQPEFLQSVVMERLLFSQLSLPMVFFITTSLSLSPARFLSWTRMV
jgi:hypothetical protein